nr:integrase, catalytic region, zinc finger, CCHC-type, peptidase aspartic, catalytic [Tanacetum cinerariifolium]
MIENHSMDRLVKDVLMMELVMHTEKNDTVFHMEKTSMLMLVVEIDVGGMTADVVDKFSCSSDDVKPRKVDPRLYDLFDENNLFIFDDESVRISPVSKMPFRIKPSNSLNVRSKRNSNKSLPKTQQLAEPVAKWIPRVIVQIFLWIIDSGCSKHMTGNRALLTNFVEKFLGTVLFGNNDFAVSAGYGDVVIGLMTIKKVYYVEGL